MNRSIPWYCNTIKGTSGLYLVWSKYIGGIFTIKTRKFACFYEFWISAGGCRLDQCEKHRYIKGWKYVPLNPKGSHPIQMWKEMKIHPYSIIMLFSIHLDVLEWKNWRNQHSGPFLPARTNLENWGLKPSKSVLRH